MTYATYNRITERRLRTKASRNYGARVGETIAGNLGRGQGGRFAAAGSGTGQKPRKPRKSAAERMAERRRTRDQTLQAAGLTASEAAALTALTKGQELTELRAAGLIKQGLAEVGADGKIRATPTGRRAARVAETGDLEKVQEAISTGIDRQQRQREREQRRAEARQRRETRNRQQRERSESREPAPRRENPSNSDRNDRLPKAPASGIRSGVRDMTRLSRRKQAPFSVFKQANGRYRWVLVSSCAYRDRDQEIVSTKALEGAVVIADQTGYRGPLRWWHVRGLDIGDCDFQAMHGRFLIESGTFRDERIGAAVARKAHVLQGSIGFTHPRQEPDARGVFHHIAIFERSLTPLGRAANPLTRLVVKEDRSMNDTKREALKQLLSDDALLDQLLAQVAQTDNAAQSAGVDFKSDDPANDEATEKAVPSDEDLADEEPLLTTKEIALIADSVVERLSGVLDFPNQLKQIVDRFSSMVGEQTKRKDDELAAIREQSDKRVAAVERRLKTLEGDQPRAFHRASESESTEADAETVKALGGPERDSADPVLSGLASFLTGRPQAHP